MSSLNMRTTFSITLTILLIGSGITHAKDTIRLAVIYFENITPAKYITQSELGNYKVDPRYNYLERAFPAMLMTDLAYNREIELLERSRVEKLLDEIHLDQTALVDKATAQDAGKALSADVILTATIEKVGKLLLIHPALHWISPYKVTELKIVKGPETDLLRLEEELAVTVSGALSSSPNVNQTHALKLPTEAAYAVLPFNNNSDDSRLDYLGPAIADLLTSAMSIIKGIQLVERDRLSSAIAELQLGRTGWIDTRTALETGHLLGAQYILQGSFVTAGDRIRLDVQLSSVESGRTMSQKKSTGKYKDLKKVINQFLDLQ